MEDAAIEKLAIQDLKRGDLEGLRALYELHYNDVFRTALWVLRNQQLAEDSTQEVFIKLPRKILSFDCERPFKPWLHVVAVNQSLTALRKNKPGDDHTVPLDGVRDLPSPSPAGCPATEAEIRETQAALKRALGHLSPKHRAVIVLRYYQGFSYREIADALNCKEGVVKSRIHNAIKRLHRILDDLDDSGPETPPQRLRKSRDPNDGMFPSSILPIPGDD